MAVDPEASTAMARAFLDALGGSDDDAVRALFAPEARFWVNISASVYTVPERLDLLALERTHLQDLVFDDVRTLATPSGFVLQFTTRATVVGGEALRIPVCIVAGIVDGEITLVEEYADSRAAAPLLRAMFARGTQTGSPTREQAR